MKRMWITGLVLLVAVVGAWPSGSASAQTGLAGSFFWEDYAFAMNYPLVWGFPTQLTDTKWAIAPNLADVDNPTPSDTVLTVEYLDRATLDFPETDNTFIDLRNGFSDFARAYTGVEGLSLSLTLEETDYGYNASTAYRDDLNTKIALVLVADGGFVLQLSDPNGDWSLDGFARVLATVLVGEAALTPPTIGADETPLSIAPGVPIVGTISDGQYEQTYIFQAEPGQFLTVSMVANDIDLDPLLAVYADRTQIGYNDDALGTYDALVANVELPPARFYTIRATRFSGFGDYTLTVTLSDTSDPSTWLGDLTLQGDIAPNEPITDNLGPFQVGHAWLFEGARGSVITVDMIASEGSDLDPYLVLFDSSGNYLAGNDDLLFGENYNAQLTRVRLPDDGDYYVIASKYGGTSGGYTLTLTIE